MRKNIYDFDGKLVGFMLEGNGNRRMHTLDMDVGGMLVFTHKKEIFNKLHEQHNRPNEESYTNSAIANPSRGKDAFKSKEELDVRVPLLEDLPYQLSNLPKSIEDRVLDHLDEYLLSGVRKNKVFRNGKDYFDTASYRTIVSIVHIENTNSDKFRIRFKSLSDKMHMNKWIQDFLNTMPVEIITPHLAPDLSFKYSKDYNVRRAQEHINKFNKEVLDRYKNISIEVLDEVPQKKRSFSDDPITKTLRSVHYEPPVELEPIEIKEKTQQEKVDSAMKRFCR